MQFPARFSDLPEYAFPRLRRLLAGVPAGGPEFAMTIGEPKHPLPDLVPRVIAEYAREFALYPPNEGTPDLRTAIAAWLGRRYGLAVDPDTEIVPLNGTREGLFNAAIALSPETKAGARPAVLMPNPFYQAYGAAALAVGAEPVPVPATAETGFLPDFAALPAALLDRVTLCYLCSPSNPQGAVAETAYWRALIALAERHDFRILADECYGEIYRDSPPPGALETAAAEGADPERVVIFHSLSKRSNAPGLRSGFAAGGPRSIAALRQLRAYGGAPVPLPNSARLDGPLAGRGACRGEPRALPREVRAGRPAARRDAGLHRAAGRLLSLAPGRRRRGGGAAALARDRRSRAARRLPRPGDRRRA